MRSASRASARAEARARFLASRASRSSVSSARRSGARLGSSSIRFTLPRRIVSGSLGGRTAGRGFGAASGLSLIHISEPTRLALI
eukprot:6410554-Alexandrium_andersonii.AAC.1